LLSATCHKLDLLAEIAELRGPAHERDDITKPSHSQVGEELPAEMVETEAAFLGEGIAMVLRGLEMLTLTVWADARPNQVPFPTVERRREEEGTARPQDARALRKRRLVVRDMLQNFHAEKEVKAGVGKRQGSQVFAPDPCRVRLARQRPVPQKLTTDDLRKSPRDSPVERCRLFGQIDPGVRWWAK
jgi:hypothetical protein